MDFTKWDDKSYKARGGEFTSSPCPKVKKFLNKNAIKSKHPVKSRRLTQQDPTKKIEQNVFCFTLTAMEF